MADDVYSLIQNTLSNGLDLDRETYGERYSAFMEHAMTDTGFYSSLAEHGLQFRKMDSWTKTQIKKAVVPYAEIWSKAHPIVGQPMAHEGAARTVKKSAEPRTPKVGDELVSSQPELDLDDIDPKIFGSEQMRLAFQMFRDGTLPEEYRAQFIEVAFPTIAKHAVRLKEEKDIRETARGLGGTEQYAKKRGQTEGEDVLSQGFQLEGARNRSDETPEEAENRKFKTLYQREPEETGPYLKGLRFFDRGGIPESDLSEHERQMLTAYQAAAADMRPLDNDILQAEWMAGYEADVKDRKAGYQQPTQFEWANLSSITRADGQHQLFVSGQSDAAYAGRSRGLHHFGMVINEDNLNRLTNVMREDILKRFDAHIITHSGALRKTIETGKVTVQYGASTGGRTETRLIFSPNLEGRSDRATDVTYYAPLVWGGRGEILNEGIMTFQAGNHNDIGRWVKTYHVNRSEPKGDMIFDAQQVFEDYRYSEILGKAFAEAVVQNVLRDMSHVA